MEDELKLTLEEIIEHIKIIKIDLRSIKESVNIINMQLNHMPVKTENNNELLFIEKMNNIENKINTLISTKETLDNIIKPDDNIKNIEINKLNEENNNNILTSENQDKTILKNKEEIKNIETDKDIINIDDIDNKILKEGFEGINILIVDESKNIDDEFIMKQLANINPKFIEEIETETEEKTEEEKENIIKKSKDNDDEDEESFCSNIKDNDDEDFPEDDNSELDDDNFEEEG